MTHATINVQKKAILLYLNSPRGVRMNATPPAIRDVMINGQNANVMHGRMFYHRLPNVHLNMDVTINLMAISSSFGVNLK